MKVYLMEDRQVVGSLTEVFDGNTRQYISVFKEKPPVEYQNHQKLPSPYQNHVISRNRPEYKQLMEWLGLWPSLDTPMKILSRIGKGTQTDNYYIAPDPTTFSYCFFIENPIMRSFWDNQTLFRDGDNIVTSEGDKVGNFPPLVQYPDFMIIQQINWKAPNQFKILLRVENWC